MTHICINKIIIIGSDNGLSPCRRQAIIWTNAGILLIGPFGTNFSGTSIEIHTFSFKKMHFKMSSAKWRLSGLGLNELTKFCYDIRCVDFGCQWILILHCVSPFRNNFIHNSYSMGNIILLNNSQSSHHYKLLHMPWQLCCHGMCRCL